MARATIRPATSQDVAALIAEPLPFRILAFAMEADGVLLGIGGFSHQPEDVIAAFAIWTEGAKHYPVAKHRAGMMAMRAAQQAGYRRIVALADHTNEAAERWLKRFGFELKMVDDKKTWVWERNRVE